MKFLISSLIFLLISSANLVGQVKLAYDLKVGDTFLLNQKTEQTVKQDITGMNIELVNVINGDFLLKVKEVKADSYIIEFTFVRFAYQMVSETMGGNILDVDTDRPEAEDDQTNKIFRGLLNVPMEFEMLKTGKIINTSGEDALVDSMIKNSGVTDPTQLEQMRAGMEKEYGGQKIAAGFEQFTYIYPNATKNVGESWSNNLSGDLQADNTWTLDAINTSGYAISGDGDMAIKIDSNGTVINASGKQSTNITADSNHGFIKNFHSESTATGNSKVAQMPDVTIPTTIITITDYTVN